MTIKYGLRAGLFVAVSMIMFGNVSVTEGPKLSVSSAKAADDYYTKKRVRGRWIQGKFLKKAAIARRSRRQEIERPVVQTAQNTPVPAAGPLLRPSSPPPLPFDATDVVPQNPALLKGLQERASKMAVPGAAISAAAGSQVQAAPISGNAATPNKKVKSVAYDWDEGIKNILYTDGTMEETSIEE